MLINILYVLTLVLIDVLLAAKIINFLHSYFTIHPLFGSKENVSFSDPIEVPNDESSFRPKYDVKAFRQRMDNLRKDKDGLYDIVDESPVTDFTGAEIITDNFEKDVDRRYSR